MKAPHLWPRSWKYTTAAAGLAIVGYGSGRQLGTFQPNAARAPSLASLPADPAEAAEGTPTASDVVTGPSESVIEAQRKRIMGRLRSLEMVRRVVTSVRPHVDRAIELPSIQGDLRKLAAAAGLSLEKYKEYFKGKQEADLLLESGGDPNARSVANAIGVAQYLAGTGRQCGLKINVGASEALSREIAQIEKKIEWLEARPVAWTRAVPAGLKGVVPTVPEAELVATSADASLLPAPSAESVTAPPGEWTRDQWIAYRKSQRRKLVMRRRAVDERYDPAKAITAQTRYLVKLTRRYGGVDWALQAYHGGEGGANRTIRLYTEAAGPRTLLASRGSSIPGKGRLSYAELYRGVTPTATPGAFSYLFGRSDDHRYYWWKVLMAERALNLYRKDPKEFERQWQALQPGMNADAAYYPDPEPLQFANNAALREAYRNGTLVALPRNAAALGLRTDNLAVLDPGSASLHKGLRPEAMGALLRVAHLYRSFGGSETLTVVSMVQSNAYRSLWKQRYPDPPLPEGVPRDPEFHSTGLVFQIKRPSRDWDRKILEYAMGRLYDTLRISWRSTSAGGSRRYHLVVNPEFKTEMAAYYQKAVR